MGMVEKNMGGVEEFVNELKSFRKAAVGGEVRELDEVLDELLSEFESADTIVFNYNEKVGNEIETQYYRSSWLSRFRKIEYAYVISNEIETRKIIEGVRFNEDDDYSAIFEYRVSGDSVIIKVDINNFDNEFEFTKTLWITFLGGEEE